MAKTLLNAVNEILKRVGMIAGDAGELSTLTDGARQRAIDIAVQVIGEGVDALYVQSAQSKPKEMGEDTITLVTGTRAYSLATDLVQLRWPMIDRTNSQFIQEFPGGYEAMLEADPEQDDTGLPLYGAIRPTDGLLHLDRAPTSAENGRQYHYPYDKDLTLDEADDTVPFGDAVFRAMVPVWVQLWKREMRSQFDGELFATELGVASTLLSQKPFRTSYSPRG